MPLLVHIDEPIAGASCDPIGFFVQGWVHDTETEDAFESIEVVSGETLLGKTSALSERIDVANALKLPAGSRTGFRILCYAPSQNGIEDAIEIRGQRRGESLKLDARSVRYIATDYRHAPFGNILNPDFSPILHREHVYTSGPSWPGTSDECLNLIKTFLGPPPKRVLDVGCGLGGYARPLLESGYDWLGVEMKPADVAELARLGLPHQKIDGRTLPFANASFDAAMCVEVLEHIDDVAEFLAEIKRVAPRLVVSVPNFEVVPYLNDYQVVPWHMLESDHKNFFTRWSLRALLAQFYTRIEVTAYGKIPLNGREGTPLFYHLFARAEAQP